MKIISNSMKPIKNISELSNKHDEEFEEQKSLKEKENNKRIKKYKRELQRRNIEDLKEEEKRYTEHDAQIVKNIDDDQMLNMLKNYGN